MYAVYFGFLLQNLMAFIWIKFFYFVNLTAEGVGDKD